MAGRLRLLACFGFFAAVLFVYLLTCNQIFSFDAVTNGLALDAGEPARWFHSNHIFYPFLGVPWLWLERLVGYQGYSIYSLARLNSLLASGGLAVFAWALSRRIGTGRAILSAAFLATTYAVWHFAVDGRAVGASFAFSLFLVALLVGEDSKPTFVASLVPILSFLSAMYVFVHGIAIFHTAGVAWWILRKTRHPRWAMGYLALFGAIVLVTYFLIHRFVVLPFHSVTFPTWVIGYAAHQGGEVLSSPFWARNAGGLIGGWWEGWARALLKAGPGSGGMIAAYGAGILALLGIGWSLSRWKFLPDQDKPLVQSLLLWTILVAVFIGAWSPGQEGFRLHFFAPLLTAVIFLLAKQIWLWRLLGVFSAVLFALNFSWSIFPASFITNNRGYQMLAEIRSALRPNDLLLSASNDAIPDIEVLRPYFFPDLQGGTVSGWLFAYQGATLEGLADRLKSQSSQGRGIYFSADLMDPVQQASLEHRLKLGSGAMAQFTNRFEVKRVVPLSTGEKIFEVGPKVRGT